MSVTYVPCPKCNKLNRVRLEESASKEPICGHCRATLPLHFSVAEVNGTGLRILAEKSPLPVICDFWAPWCGPCKAFAPLFQEAAHRFADRAVFVKLNTEQNQQAGDAYQVRSIPTLVCFKSGVEWKRLSGALPLDEFAAWVEDCLKT